jgi:hypothetical protein
MGASSGSSQALTAESALQLVIAAVEAGEAEVAAATNKEGSEKGEAAEKEAKKFQKHRLETVGRVQNNCELHFPVSTCLLTKNILHMY